MRLTSLGTLVSFDFITESFANKKARKAAVGTASCYECQSISLCMFLVNLLCTADTNCKPQDGLNILVACIYEHVRLGAQETLIIG